tara:strand:- start:2763 stop:3335 length:573 start_codon:yes stop_codon:yes gene_type:complete
MPTLDDIPILPQITALSANDSIVVSETGGSGSSLVKRIPAALLSLGFTHAFRIDYDNALLTGSSATLTLMALTEGSVVTAAGVMVSTAFDGTDISSVVVDVDRTGSAEAYIKDMEVEATNEVFNRNTGALLDVEAEEQVGDIIPSGQSLLVDFASSTSGSTDLDDLTQGSLIVFVNVVDPSEFATLVPAE